MFIHEVRARQVHWKFEPLSVQFPLFSSKLGSKSQGILGINTRASLSNLENSSYEDFIEWSIVHSRDYGSFTYHSFDGYGRETEGLVFGREQNRSNNGPQKKPGVVIGSGHYGVGGLRLLCRAKKGALGPLSLGVSLDPEVEAGAGAGVKLGFSMLRAMLGTIILKISTSVKTLGEGILSKKFPPDAELMNLDINVLRIIKK
ncbi:hypothetical protein Tco_0482133 [Tanacetum coccineum]